MMSEDEIIEIVKNEITNTYAEGKAIAFQGLLDLYQKEKEKNKKMERKWDEEKYLIKLAENELLGYSQGYEDGFNHNSTATQQVIKGRESEIHQLETERLKKIISKLKKENEELDEKFKYAVPDEIVAEKYISKDKIREKIKETEKRLRNEYDLYERAKENSDEQHAIHRRINMLSFVEDEIKELLEESNENIN